MHWMAAEPEPAGDREVLFSLRNLAHTYADATPGLRDISLDINPGDRIALVGRNGSGKSTLIRHLVGLLPVQAGECRYQGQPLHDHPAADLRSRVGLLFQDPDDMLFCPTLYEDVAFGPRNRGRSEAEVDRLVRHWLAAVGLADLLFKPPHHLSYGQKKRAALAAVLAMEPAVLILDEPSAHLDSRHKEAVKGLLADFAGTLIVIDHDLFFLHGLCERAIVLADGCVHHDYRFTDLIAQPRALRDHGLDFSFRFACCGSDDGASEPHRHHRPTHTHAAATSHLPPSDLEVPLIELQHYSFRYPDGTPGIEDVNLCVFAGQTVALVGENGAGKSTLAGCLLGVLRGEGDLLLDGRPLAAKQTDRLWRRVGMVFQHADEHLVCPSCWEEVAFGPQQMGLPAGEVDRRAREALERVGLGGFGHRVPLHMSGGERKRLAIAAALSLAPELLILDEPTSGLDPQGEELLLAILASLPMALVLISHDPLFIHRLCQRTVVLHRGRIIRDDDTPAFFADDRLKAAGGLDFTFSGPCAASAEQHHST